MKGKDKLIITKLQLQNIMKLKAVKIKPDGSVVRIAGDNDQGKTAILRGIEMGLMGKKAFPADPIRHGEKQGAVRIDLGDGETENKYTIDTKISPYSLIVTDNSIGEKVKGPRKFLDDTFSSISFDPLSIIREKASNQVELVKNLFGIDFTELDKEYDKLYQDRRDVNRDLDSLQKRVKAQPKGEDVKTVSVDALLKELSTRQATNKKHNDERAKLEDLRRQRDRAKVAVEEAELILLANKGELEAIYAAGKKLKGAVDQFIDADTGEIENKLQKSASINDNANNFKLWNEIKVEIDKKDSASKKYTDRLSEIKEEKTKIVRETDFGVKEINFSENGLMLGDILLDQIGAAEQMRVSFAMLAKANPRAGVALMQEGSLLDEEHKKMIAQIADEYGMQAWLEIVGDDPAAFIVSAGEVVREPIKGE